MVSKDTTKNSYPGPERRQHPRISLDTMVDIVLSDEEYFFDFALNFSARGFFFETEKNLTLGQEVRVLFPLPLENWVYQATAIPIWHYKNPDENNYTLESPEGYGFKITAFASEEDQQKIEAYMHNPPDFSQVDEIV
ncbi:MAG TPA: PilZ domain-containing protein [Oligoflexia bacterium]|nr:PilZ domain-containing protein [Oligoflexia bacterium]HMR25679.1 PilZ domain-containing protein [Oligoflexia bacterium]